MDPSRWEARKQHHAKQTCGTLPPSAAVLSFHSHITHASHSSFLLRHRTCRCAFNMRRIRPSGSRLSAAAGRAGEDCSEEGREDEGGEWSLTTPHGAQETASYLLILLNSTLVWPRQRGATGSSSSTTAMADDQKPGSESAALPSIATRKERETVTPSIPVWAESAHVFIVLNYALPALSSPWWRQLTINKLRHACTQQ